VFPDWAFPFDKRRWKLLSTDHQQQLHLIFGVIFSCTNMYDLWAPDFPQWAFPINHEQQHEIGLILYETPYWRRMLLPGDAAEAAGLTRRTFDIDTDNEPDTE
jgi:hypothetical protein